MNFDKENVFLRYTSFEESFNTFVKIFKDKSIEQNNESFKETINDYNIKSGFEGLDDQNIFIPGNFIGIGCKGLCVTRRDFIFNLIINISKNKTVSNLISYNDNENFIRNSFIVNLSEEPAVKRHNQKELHEFQYKNLINKIEPINYQIYIKASCTFELDELLEFMEKMVKNNNVKLFVIDSIESMIYGLVDENKSKILYSEISNKLKEFALKNKIVIILTFNLGESILDNIYDEPNIKHVKELGKFEFYLDVVLLLTRPIVYKWDHLLDRRIGQSEILLYVAKNNSNFVFSRYDEIHFEYIPNVVKFNEILRSWEIY